MTRTLAAVVLVACAHAQTVPASSAWEGVQAIETHAAASVGGMTGTLDTVEDVATGRSLSALALGAVSAKDGWDGRVAWEQTVGGEVVVKDAPAAIAQARTAAWLTQRGYLKTTGAAYRDAGDHVDATPDGGAPIALYFDAQHRLVRTIDHDGAKVITTDYSDYRRVDGVELPFHVVIDDGDPRNRFVVDVASAKRVASPAATAFAAPSADERVAFAHGVTHTDVPFDLVNNHIYIHASVDGQPVRMLVDTGGLNLLTPAAAKRLGIAAEGNMAISGTGADKASYGLGHGKTIAVGDLSLADPVFYVVDLGKLADVEGEEFDGLVGFEMFSRVRVRIDYPGRVLTLTSAQAFAAPAAAVAVPFELEDRTPIVQGSIDGIDGRMWIDTGSRVGLTTTAKFTTDHDLAAKYKPPFETVTGWGVGGPSSSSPVRFHEVKLGGAAVHDVVGDLFTGDKGSFADPDAAGNVGGGMLKRFVVTFDYAAKVMYLERKTDDREVYDRSGLFVIRDGDALRVISAAPHTPAASAGLRTDDRITAIDGAPIASRPLAAWRDHLSSAPGTKVRMHVERAGDVTVTLAELIP